MMHFNRKKLMLEFISIVLIMVLFFTSSGLTYASEKNTPVVSISQTEADPGDTVSVTVNLLNNPGITTVDFRVAYNSEVMELQSKINGSLLNGMINSQNLTDNPYYCGWFNSLQKTDCTSDGTLITLIFKVKSAAAPGTYAVAIEAGSVTGYNANLGEVKFGVSQGSVKVKGAVSEEPGNSGSAAAPGISGDTSTGGTSSGNTSTGTSGSIAAGDQQDDQMTEEEKAAAAEKQKKLIKKFEATTVNITSAKFSKTNNRVTLKFKKTNSGIKCPQYQIWRSTRKNSGYKKIYTTSKTTFTNKSLGKSVKAYYYKIRGVRKFDGKTYYTQWSKKVKVNITR